MASQSTNKSCESEHTGDQAQMRRDEILNHLSEQGHSTNLFQETGTQVKQMAQGAAEVGKDVAQGAVNLAREAALGATNMAHGAADAVKSTLGMNSPDGTTNNDESVPLNSATPTDRSDTTSTTTSATKPANPINTRV